MLMDCDPLGAPTFWPMVMLALDVVPPKTTAPRIQGLKVMVLDVIPTTAIESCMAVLHIEEVSATDSVDEENVIDAAAEMTFAPVMLRVLLLAMFPVIDTA